MVRPLPPLGVCLALGVLLGLVRPGWATERTPGALLADVAALESAVEDRTLLPPGEAAERFEDALFAFMVGDHEVAAERAYALRPFLPPGPVRQEADHVLATSLVHLGSVALAQRVNAEILAEQGHPFSIDAAASQIELFALHRSAEEFATLYQQLRNRGLTEEATGALAYAIGRAHWHLGDVDGAAEAFARVKPDGLYSDRSAYHLGVIDVVRGNLAEAQARFDQLRKAPLTDPDIAELSTLALARIAHEEGRHDEAAELYRFVAEDSPRRATALEELAWTELERGDVAAATLALEERLTVGPDGTSPEVQVALGQLHLRFGEAESAEVAFDGAVETFEHVNASAQRLYADPMLADRVVITDPPPDEDAWALQHLRDNEAVTRAATSLSGSRAADAGLANTRAGLRALSARLQADPLTLRDKRLLSEACAMLLDLAEARLQGLDNAMSQASRREGRSGRERVASLRAEVDATRHQFERLASMHDDGSLKTALQLVAQTREGVEGLEVPDRFADVEKRLRDVIRAVRDQVRARDGPVQAKLALEQRQLLALEEALRTTRARAEATWLRARAAGTEAVLAEVDGHLRTARVGLADASWARLTELRDRQVALSDVRREALAQLDQLFALVRSRSAGLPPRVQRPRIEDPLGDGVDESGREPVEPPNEMPGPGLDDDAGAPP